MSAPVPAALSLAADLPPVAAPPPPPLPCDVLLITGSRSLTATGDAARWTWLQVAGALFGPRFPGRILTGDGPGAQALARSIAMSARIPFDVFRVDGTVGCPEGDYAWLHGPLADDRTRPVHRSRALVARAHAELCGGAVVRALILKAGWSKRRGQDYAADVARDAGLAVDFRVCPLSLGPQPKGGAR